MAAEGISSIVNNHYPALRSQGWADFNLNGKLEPRETLIDADNNRVNGDALDYLNLITNNSRELTAAFIEDCLNGFFSSMSASQLEAQTIPAIKILINFHDISTREKAINRLIGLGEGAVTKAIQLLRDLSFKKSIPDIGELEMAIAIIRALGKNGGKQARQVLLECEKSSIWQIRHEAHFFLYDLENEKMEGRFFRPKVPISIDLKFSGNVTDGTLRNIPDEVADWLNAANTAQGLPARDYSKNKAHLGTFSFSPRLWIYDVLGLGADLQMHRVGHHFSGGLCDTGYWCRGASFDFAGAAVSLPIEVKTPPIHLISNAVWFEPYGGVSVPVIRDNGPFNSKPNVGQSAYGSGTPVSFNPGPYFGTYQFMRGTRYYGGGNFVAEINRRIDFIFGAGYAYWNTELKFKGGDNALTYDVSAHTTDINVGFRIRPSWLQ